MNVQSVMSAGQHLRTEPLTLAVLMCGVAALALSDFVSPIYWSLPVIAGIARVLRGTSFSLSEMQASFIGWFGFFWVGLELILGRAWIVAFTDFLLILALAVTIETPTPRNHLHRMLTGFFLVLAGAVLTDSVLYMIPIIAMMWFFWRAGACLYSINDHGDDLPVTPAKQDMRIMPAMLLITLAFFVLLPRFDFHFKLKAAQPRMMTNGFTDQVNLGDFARELDPTVVMRIEPLTDDPALQQLLIGQYWRGPVLNRFTGKGWQRTPARDAFYWQRNRSARFNHGNTSLHIAVYREATDHAYIFYPQDRLLRINDLPDNIHGNIHGSLMFDRAPSRRLKIMMDLARRTDSPINLAESDSSASALHHMPPALITWLQQLTINEASPEQALNKVHQELRSWTYDLNAPVNNDHPIASFLQNKRGHCELYATTMTLAARQLGFPARIVNGYFGGEWNDTGKFLLLRQQHAHSWSEVWLNNQWRRLDATPSTRWELSSIRFPAWDTLWESVRLSWYRYVLEFENQDRAQLLQTLLRIFQQSLGWLVIFGIFLAVFWYLRAVLRSRDSADRRQQRSRRMQLIDKWLLQRGYVRHPSCPLRHIPQPSGVSAETWNTWITECESEIYRASTASDIRPSLSRLRRRLRALSQAHW
ncbi:MAG: DUF3488 domain-containing protein [Zetaproteobacteria bacterium CG_4_9_14_3_um_filter_49_83]|nr:MAG: hypothetical protein COW62_11290 [Zetaproteobacteria bacterium CG17_big_fil_post_rev_8_21_14_2_50_50_13]PIV29839.1 MAG: DUF3488 domain-containing protein [Zetaproteobacteria bacterium CG02_land_8_20_14_3_00_50_9]PIY56690.1 MAG: DUF3488 domain-containing protein [Zetaproteobacteria bacterium CG_4_10_14_0_8_um_filter_49_80]PJA36252.1 MAG: DUF3488 domain-containing protein [Zetaproteobacteria bacterium CG_4_9_14_3_um_filter_49_83]